MKQDKLYSVTYLVNGKRQGSVIIAGNVEEALKLAKEKAARSINGTYIKTCSVASVRFKKNITIK